MRAYLSLIAVVVVVVAGQAQATSFGRITKLQPSDDVLDLLGADVLERSYTEELLLSADDRSVKVCNEHTIDEILAINDVTREDCTEEGNKQRSYLCGGLQIDVDQTCRNVGDFYCYKQSKFEERCNDPRFTFVAQTEATPEEAQKVLRELGSGLLPFDSIELIMEESLNSKIEVCNQHTVNEIHQSHLISQECNLEQELRKSLQFCDGLKKDGDTACANVRHYCRKMLEFEVLDKIQTGGQIVHLGSASEAYVAKLAETLKETEDEYEKGSTLNVEYANKMTPLENFIMTGL